MRGFGTAFLRRLFPISLLVFAYLAIAVLVTFPLILNFDKGFVYYPAPAAAEHLDPRLSDVSYSLWTLWWFNKSTVDLGVSPLFSTYDFYPNGVSLLTNIDGPLNYLVGTILQRFLNLFTSYNSLVIFNLVFGGVAAFYFAKHFLKDNLPSFLSGLFVLTSSYMINRTLTNLNLQSVGWSFLFLLFLFRYLEEGDKRNYLSTVVFSFLSAASSVYLFAMSSVVSVLYVGVTYSLGRSFFRLRVKRLAAAFFWSYLVLLGFIAFTLINRLMRPHFLSNPWPNDLFSFLFPSKIASSTGLLGSIFMRDLLVIRPGARPWRRLIFGDFLAYFPLPFF